MISVLIPAYNEAELIHETVQQILTQLPDDAEVIICDDASTDGTGKRCHALADQDDRIQLLQNEQNQGIIGTVQRLVNTANEDLLLRLDADTRPEPGVVGEVLSAWYDGAELVLTPIHVSNTGQLHPLASQISKETSDGALFGGGCMAVSRNALISSGGINEGMKGAEAQELRDRAERLGWQVSHTETPVKSVFPTDMRGIARRKFNSAQGPVRRAFDADGDFNIRNLRGPLFWTIVIAGVIIQNKDVLKAVKKSGQLRTLITYPCYQIASGLLRTLGVWTFVLQRLLRGTIRR